MLLNLVSAANASNKDVLWGFIRREAPDATPRDRSAARPPRRLRAEILRRLREADEDVSRADEKERAALEDLAARLNAGRAPLDGESLQTMVFAVGTERQFEPLRAWFTAIYEVCLGQSQGPRFGGFVALYGVKETAQLIRDALAGKIA